MSDCNNDFQLGKIEGFVDGDGIVYTANSPLANVQYVTTTTVDISELSRDASKHQDTFAIIIEMLKEKGYHVVKSYNQLGLKKYPYAPNYYTTWAEFFRACMEILAEAEGKAE